MKPDYNIAPLATNSTGWKHYEESLDKMRNNYSEERRQRVGNINSLWLGKLCSGPAKGCVVKDKTPCLAIGISSLATQRGLPLAGALWLLQRKPMSMESRLKCAVNVRPITITNLDGTNPQSFIASG